MVAGDVVEISSVPKSKYAKITSSGGVTASVLYGLLYPNRGWLTLEPGTNQLSVYATGAGVPYSIKYTNKYGGL